MRRPRWPSLTRLRRSLYRWIQSRYFEASGAFFRMRICLANSSSTILDICRCAVCTHASAACSLARVLILGLIPEIGRKYRIDPLIGLNGRFQRQAEADASPRELVHIRYPSTTRYLLRRCIAVAAHRIFWRLEDANDPRCTLESAPLFRRRAPA